MSTAPVGVAGLPAPPKLEKKPVKFSNLLRKSYRKVLDRLGADRGLHEQLELA